MIDRDRAERERLEQEFFVEAEDIFERCAAHLAALEAATGAGRPAPPIVNMLFRDIHALKGVAGSLGFAEIAGLAHAFEDFLDRLRGGTAAPDATGRDLLDAGLEGLQDLVKTRRHGAAGTPATADLVRRLSALPRAAGGRPGPPVDLPIEPALLASLSRHEEDRLRQCLREGRALSLVRAGLEPAGFDAQARAVAEALAERGEVLAMLPAAGAAGDDPAGAGLLWFQFLVASREALDAGASVAGVPLHVTQVTPALRSGGSTIDDTAADTGGEPGSLESVRVPVGRLDELLAQVGDLSVAAAALLDAAARARDARPDDRDVRDVDRKARALLLRLRALQRGTVQVRLVPLVRVFGPLARLARRTARAGGRDVEVQELGGGIEIDKSVMDELAAPLRHLVQNAIDHGIEPPAERRSAGKRERGRLELRAVQRSGRVVVEVCDDGRGIDPARVRAAAEAAGRVAPGTVLSDEQARALIFHPGLSTAARVGPVSGRGVGMDAVRAAVGRLKGSIAVRSVTGRGTTMSLTVPISLALVQALIVRAGNQRFAIPVASIRENLKLEPARVRRIEGREVYDQPRGRLPLHRLEDLLRAGDPAPAGKPAGFAVVAGGDRPLGLVVDELLGRREIVIKPLGGRLRDLPGVTGAAELGDATAVLVLDPEGLAGGAVDGGVAA